MEPETTPRKPLSTSSPGSSAYEAHSELIYSLFSFYLADPEAAVAMTKYGASLSKMVPAQGYRRYQRTLCLQLALQELFLCELMIPELHAPLSREESVAILLADGFHLPCKEIAAGLRSSEGTIRTRLRRARQKLFTTLAASRSKDETHRCLYVQDLLEDSSEEQSTELQKSIAECPNCLQFLELKKKSTDLLQNRVKKRIPDRLAQFHETPVLIKEGSRWVLNWSSAPWYLKALFEGLLASCLILGVVLSIPRVKQIYEFWLERRLDLYTIAELTSQVSTEETSNETAGPASTAPVEQVSAPGEDVDADSEEGPGAPRILERISADNTYRFIVKTDGPDGMKPDVLKILDKYDATPADKENPTGIDLPGGILFNVYIPIKSYRGLHTEIYSIAGNRENVKTGSARSHERPVQGKVHIRIWLQRI